MFFSSLEGNENSSDDVVFITAAPKTKQNLKLSKNSACVNFKIEEILSPETFTRILHELLSITDHLSIMIRQSRLNNDISRSQPT